MLICSFMCVRTCIIEQAFKSIQETWAYPPVHGCLGKPWWLSPNLNVGGRGVASGCLRRFDKEVSILACLLRMALHCLRTSRGSCLNSPSSLQESLDDPEGDSISSSDVLEDRDEELCDEDRRDDSDEDEDALPTRAAGPVTE